MKRVLLVIVLASCSESHAPSFGPPATFEVVAGADQVDTVARLLATPIQVRVTDEQELPVEGQLVNFVIVEGGGAMFGGSALTDSNGLAADRWTLGTVAGEQRVEVRAVDSDGAMRTFATVRATALPGALAYQGFTDSVLVVPADSEIALPVHATDAYGNAVAAPSPVAADTGYGAVNGLTWTPAKIGYVRFTLAGGSALHVYVRIPSGSFAVDKTVGSVRWRETGTLAFVEAGTRNSACTAVSGEGAISIHYRLTNVTTIRDEAGVSDTTFNAPAKDDAITQRITRDQIPRNRQLRYFPRTWTNGGACGVDGEFEQQWRWSVGGQATDSLVIRP